MSAHDESKYSWLKAEKDLIGQAIETGKPILGVCLGSQLIADVLGSKVYKNSEPEIGWFPIELSEKATSHELGETHSSASRGFSLAWGNLRPAPRSSSFGKQPSL